MMRHWTACLILFLLCRQAALFAADWPQWRADVSRSGSTDEQLSEALKPAWEWRLPAAQIAWPNEPRLHFDASYHPVVAGQTVVVGSPNDGSVMACDLRSGKQLWKTYTDGPVRCSVAIRADQVFAGSDDGYLYCLDLASGRVVWRVRGAPADRPDFRHLGNARMISYWPVRGGPVIHDETVYFGAGVWPSMGVFMVAVDAESGDVKWRNDDCHYLDKVRIDHNELHEAGLSPQGHFLVVNNKLLVPNGRSMPAGFDLASGKLLYYVQGYRNGDARVIGAGEVLLVGQRGVVNVKDGREVGNRWTAAGKNAPQGWDGRKRDLFEGPFYGYKFLRGCDATSAVDRKTVYGVENGVVYAYDLSRPKISLYDKKVGDQTIQPARWDVPTRWRVNTPWRGRKLPTHSVIRVGSRVYSHSGDHLFAVDLPQAAEKARISWTYQLDGTPAELAAANGHLLVSMTDGRLICFAAPSSKPVQLHAAPRSAGPAPNKQLDANVVARYAKLKGYALVIGLEDGGYVEQLIKQTGLQVVAIDADADLIRELRDRWVEKGWYGERVEILRGKLDTLRLPPYMARVILTEEDSMPGELGRVLAWLRPYGGECLLPRGGVQVSVWQQRIDRLTSFRGDVVELDNFAVARRPGPLPGTVDWTHESGDAARTFFSRDERVRAPLALLWYGDGADYGFEKWKDYGRGVKPQVAGGVLAAFDDREQQLSVLDVYTGRLLWRAGVPTPHARFVTRADGVYLAYGTACHVYDRETGRKRSVIEAKLPDDLQGKPGVVGIRVTDKLLLLAIGTDLPPGHSHPAIESGMWDATILVGFDRATGRQLWVHRAEKRFNLHAIAVGGGRVYCTDSMAPLEADGLVRRGSAPKTFPSTTRALDATTGKVAWTRTYQYSHRAMTGRGPLAIRPYDDWLTYDSDRDRLLLGKVNIVRSVEAVGGNEVWKSNGGMQPIILRGDTFIDQAGRAYDTLTGKQQQRSPLFRRGGCNYAVGNKYLLFLRNKCASYVDTQSGKEYSLRNVRSGCSNSLVAANGLLSVPCFSTGCVCNYPVQTSFTMYHLPQAGQWTGEEPVVLSQDTAGD